MSIGSLDLLKIFFLRRSGRDDEHIGYLLNIPPRTIRDIGDAGSYEIEMPEGDWMGKIWKLTNEHG